jgi:F420-non-reducing hydrogenase iron-sulfur subunit
MQGGRISSFLSSIQNPVSGICSEETIMTVFEPRIFAFLCNWCAYGAADLAGVSRLQYPPNVRAIRVMCSATASPHHVLRALQEGADGVLVGG